MLTHQFGVRSVGQHQWDLSVGTLPQGTYLLRLSSGQGWMEQRIVVVR